MSNAVSRAIAVHLPAVIAALYERHDAAIDAHDFDKADDLMEEISAAQATTPHEQTMGDARTRAVHMDALRQSNQAKQIMIEHHGLTLLELSHAKDGTLEVDALANGVLLARISVRPCSDGILFLENFVSAFRSSLGTAVVRRILSALVSAFDGYNTIEGHRTTGARQRASKTGGHPTERAWVRFE